MKDKEKNDKELIDHIADTLRGHAMPYREGAWEKFAAGNKKTRKVFLWPYLSGVAAVLLLATGLFWFNATKHSIPAIGQIAVVQEQSPANSSLNPAIAPDKLPVTVSMTAPRKTAENKSDISRLQSRKTADMPESAANELAHPDAADAQIANVPVNPDAAGNSSDHSEIADRDAMQATVTPGPETATSLSEEKQEDRFLRMLQDEQAETGKYASHLPDENTKLTVNADKWDLGVVLSPSVTRQQFNFGGGIAVAYHLSNRISVSTGVSMTSLGVERMQQGVFSPPQLSAASKTLTSSVDRKQDDKKLESVRTAVVGLDIPIDFKYNISKQFYASAGASFFAVINEERTNNYTMEVPHVETVNNAYGNTSLQPVMEMQHLSEKSGEQPLTSNGYNGFINLSIGHRIPLSGKIGVAVEPFIKLPVGRVARQDVNLSYGGLKIITGF